MASSTDSQHTPAEDEPLLGQPGDASQRRGIGLHYNLILGTAVLAQAGIWILTAIVWACIFTHDVNFFSPHPLLNSAGLLFIIQGILVLQPTHTKTQKINGTYLHSIFNALGISALIAGLVIIELNKNSHPETRYKSAHAILGLITYIFFFLQAIVGVAQFYVPQVLGGERYAKKVYKYHRVGGYATIVLGLAAVCATAYTDYSVGILHLQLWSLVVASLLVLAGLVPRIKKQKLGF
ncbi:MAG: hypothetical protein M1814_000876 [Vezdaea aestivalis]|nr:MAG: hypothetical protein M1814_000876 [Vezdaea aestivalis]